MEDLARTGTSLSVSFIFILRNLLLAKHQNETYALLLHDINPDCCRGDGGGCYALLSGDY